MTNRPLRPECSCPTEKLVTPIVASNIARQSGHFGNRINPIIEPLEAVPTSKSLQFFVQFMSRRDHFLRGVMGPVVEEDVRVILRGRCIVDNDSGVAVAQYAFP